MPNPLDVPALVRELAHRLAEPKPMRRGSLSTRYLKCNKPGCACANDPGARHGPYTSVVRTVAQQTRSRLVPTAHADLVRQHIEAGQRFRKDVEAYWQACEAWADAQLDATEAASPKGAPKNGSKGLSRRKSPQRSKRS